MVKHKAGQPQLLSRCSPARLILKRQHIDVENHNDKYAGVQAQIGALAGSCALMHTNARTRTDARTRARAREHRQTDTHTSAQAQNHKHEHARARARTHTHTQHCLSHSTRAPSTVCASRSCGAATARCPTPTRKGTFRPWSPRCSRWCAAGTCAEPWRRPMQMRAVAGCGLLLPSSLNRAARASLVRECAEPSWRPLVVQDPDRRPDANRLLAYRPVRERLAASSGLHPDVLADE